MEFFRSFCIQMALSTSPEEEEIANRCRSYLLAELLLNQDAKKSVIDDAEAIVKDMANSIGNQISDSPKGKGMDCLWARVDFLQGKYVGGSTFWVLSDDFERVKQNKPSKKTAKRKK
jgi:hypothetical protein